MGAADNWVAHPRPDQMPSDERSRSKKNPKNWARKMKNRFAVNMVGTP